MISPFFNSVGSIIPPLTLTSEEARACYRALVQSSINLYDYIEAERVLDLARKFLPTDFAFKDVA